MTAKICGKVLSVRHGASRKSGKPYVVGDVYDGYSVTRVYNFPEQYNPGDDVEILSFIRVGDNGNLFCSASKATTDVSFSDLPF